MATPIERAQALETLGLEAGAGAGEIRASWRRLAFETHPDRGCASYDRFIAARAAFELLIEEAAPTAEDRPSPETKVQPRRPMMRNRPSVSLQRTDFSGPIRAACQTCLEARAADPVERAYGIHVTEHLPHGAESRGRDVTYLVASPLAKGENRVALPTAILEDHRRANPRIVSIRASETGPGEYEVPDSMRTRLFPGARRVRIRFAMDVAAATA